MKKLGGITITEAIRHLALIFADRSADRSTLDELHQMAGDPGSWHKAHDLFNRIRKKTLDAERRDAELIVQYLFEEACAKTLYNLSRSAAPFDPDSPYWIVPIALATARHLGVDVNMIISAVCGKDAAFFPAEIQSLQAENDSLKKELETLRRQIISYQSS